RCGCAGPTLSAQLCKHRVHHRHPDSPERDEVRVEPSGFKVLVCGLLLGVGGCQDPPEALPVRSLVASGDVSYVCRGPDNRGASIEACPDFENERNELLALVTQTLTAEVAIINLSQGEVVDVDRS